MPDAVEAAFREYEALRTEIAAHQRTKSQYLTLAITATGAIGSFALGRNGNREALLVLPLVLSGLTIVYLRHNVDMELIGQYIRRELWPFVAGSIMPASDTENDSPRTRLGIPSWDEWIQRRRSDLRRESVYGAMGIMPPLLIFGAPSLGALVLSFANVRHSAPLTFVWGLDIVVVLISLGFTIWSYTEAPGWKHEPDLEPKPE